MERVNKYYFRVLQVAVVVLTATLFWFSFVYYPKIVADVRLGKVFVVPKVVHPVTASSYNLPITTSAYRIEYQESASTYYVFVEGADLFQYTTNRDSAILALKSATSMTDLCSLSVIYVSSGGLNVPTQYKTNSDC